MHKNVLQFRPNPTKTSKMTPDLLPTKHTGIKALPVSLSERREEMKRKFEAAMNKESEEWLENFTKLTMEHFPMGNINIDDISRGHLVTAIHLFGTYLYSIHTSQEDNFVLYTTAEFKNPDRMLQRIILCFLLEPNDMLNNALMLKYIEELDSFYSTTGNSFEGDDEELDELIEESGVELPRKNVPKVKSENQIKVDEIIAASGVLTKKAPNIVDGIDQSRIDPEDDWNPEDDSDPTYFYLANNLDYILQATTENLIEGYLTVDVSFINKLPRIEMGEITTTED